jgi:DNA-binding LytR/AlgR family response regulator
MPNLSGIELLKIINGRCQVILTTAYTQYAVEGFEHRALDYLVKPISFERFLKATQRAQEALKQVPGATIGKPQDEFFFVKTEVKGRILKIRYKDILYVEGLKNYVSIYTATERTICYLTFKQLADMLPASFIRVHKSYLVAIDKIKGIDGNQIIFYNSTAQIPLGEAYKPIFMSKLQEKTVSGRKG